MNVYRLGIIGMGGFAGSHHREATEMEKDGRARLVCTCDPNPAAAPTVWDDLKERGIPIYADYRDMLAKHADELDIIAIPTPVPLHAAMHAAAVDAGLAVYLEKPPTLYHVELEEMIAKDASAPVPTLVGFNFIGDACRRCLKTRILDGEFGPVRELQLYAYWPRTEAYYARAGWAGQLMMGDKIVLDSCVGNATAHYVENTLFWGGADLDSVAELHRVEAQLYRAHAIESADTFFIRAEAGPNNVTVRIVDTHACAGRAEDMEIVICEKATLRYRSRATHCDVTWEDGREEKLDLGEAEASRMRNNYESMFAVMEGRSTRPFTTLADCRPFVALNNLAFLSSGQITTIDSSHLCREESQDSHTVAINGVRELGDAFLAGGDFPAASEVPWAGPAPALVTPADLERFTPEWLAALT